jgi:hypothetical protein
MLPPKRRRQSSPASIAGPDALGRQIFIQNRNVGAFFSQSHGDSPPHASLTSGSRDESDLTAKTAHVRQTPRVFIIVWGYISIINMFWGDIKKSVK